MFLFSSLGLFQRGIKFARAQLSRSAVYARSVFLTAPPAWKVTNLTFGSTLNLGFSTQPACGWRRGKIPPCHFQTVLYSIYPLRLTVPNKSPISSLEWLWKAAIGEEACRGEEFLSVDHQTIPVRFKIIRVSRLGRLKDFSRVWHGNPAILLRRRGCKK